MLNIEHLFVSYERFNVLNDISVEIKSGETFGLIGLNGAGKTTLIKTILGLRQPDKGVVSFRNHGGDVMSEDQARFSTAYLPERFEPPAFLTGEEFIRFSGKLYNRRIAQDEITAAAEGLELDPSALRRGVHTFSKGMRQKLGLIATILTGCPFLILDEPMSGLDPQARVCVKDNILRLKKEGRTIFLSSHILSDMHEICDHIAVLVHGSLQFDGVCDDLMKLYSAPSLERAFLEVIKKEKRRA